MKSHLKPHPLDYDTLAREGQVDPATYSTREMFERRRRIRVGVPLSQEEEEEGKRLECEDELNDQAPHKSSFIYKPLSTNKSTTKDLHHMATLLQEKDDVSKRKVTGMEEMNRSWSPAPTFMDQAWNNMIKREDPRKPEDFDNELDELEGMMVFIDFYVILYMLL